MPRSVRSLLLAGERVLVLLVEAPEDVHGQFGELVPFCFFVLEQVVANQVETLLDFLDSSVFVARLGTRFGPQDVRNLVLRRVLEEVPHHRRSHRVQLFQFLLVFCRLFEVFVCALLPQFLFICNSLRLIFINELLNLVFFQRLKAFKKDVVLNVLENLLINMLKCFYCIEPLLRIFFIVIAFPYPVPSEFLSLSFFKMLFLLFVAQEKQIDVCFIRHSLEVYLFFC